jgi:hypothetical protein
MSALAASSVSVIASPFAERTVNSQQSAAVATASPLTVRCFQTSMTPISTPR